MPTINRHIEQAIGQVHDQQSFFDGLLAKTLEWPVARTEQIEDIAYGWSQQDLNAAGLEKELVEGSIWQIQPAEQNQPWGIFVLEFKHEDSLSPRRGMAGVLRKVLRGLVSTRRKDPRVPSWKREHLLFICTYQWTHFRFAYFRSKPDEPRVAKLATFGWTPETSNRTVCEFNLPALIWPVDTSDAESWVEGWAKAFDKEPLTRDFFKRFDNALDAIKGDLEANMGLGSGEAYTQSQLLLERLIFLYFLQNRGWLNRDRRYLLSAFQLHTSKPEQYSYYHEFLDKLFWTLATAPGSAARLSGIPFLNGGLFDDDEFLQTPNRKTNPPLKVRNKTMRYVFDELLEAFNFTVTEDTPLNQEVAVDPEMLGKVFESIVLHAEAADPDAIAPDKRKATGSYYTPRIVVHFICREVLYQYLLGHLPGTDWGPRLKGLLYFEHGDGFDEEEKELLKRTITPDQARKVLELVKPLKCCDPAVGSGAFPVGLMQELVNLRRLLETVLNGYRDPVVSHGSTWLHDTKAHIVENCLFGVDIQQQAIEICRLRLWLSLVVDYDLGLDPFSAEQRQFMEAIDRMSQLPNLEMNFRRGDSLHDNISGVPVVILPDRASRHAADFAAIAKLGGDLHKAKKAERKKRLRLDILEKRLQLSRKIVDEELQVLRQRDSALDTLFGDEEESDAGKRKRNRREIDHLIEALKKIEADQSELDKLRRREMDPQFYPKLRKLEGADFDSPFNFAWSIDFPSIFSSEGRGFDIIVGNPPFVTARNPSKRELWRQRWPRVAIGTYQLVCPFFELAFTLLRQTGQLGYIVSNAFAKREFGERLVTSLLRNLQIQKVVDCSGLLFPGHGTPTCLLFSANAESRPGEIIRNVVTLPGGGDLRTAPEDSPLWSTIANHHDLPSSAAINDAGYVLVYEDSRIAVGDCDRTKLFVHPIRWSFIEWPVLSALERSCSDRLGSALLKPFGFNYDTHQDDVFKLEVNMARYLDLTFPFVRQCFPAMAVRNWHTVGNEWLLSPYSRRWELLDQDDTPPFRFLRSFRESLEGRAVFDGGTYKSAGRTWYEFHQLDTVKSRADQVLVCPEIATHIHVIVADNKPAWPRTVQVGILRRPEGGNYHLVAGLLNSSCASFWLKQLCFNKGAGQDEERDRYVFSGNKLQQMPVPTNLEDFLKGGDNELSRSLITSSQVALEKGRLFEGLSLEKLFERPNEAYTNWTKTLPGYVPPHPDLGPPFDSTSALTDNLKGAIEIRDRLRGELVSLQEEMDWLLYSAYGLVPAQQAGIQRLATIEPLDRKYRPFALWTQAECNFDAAVNLIPKEWPNERRRVWQARLSAIRDNENVRRIEQPVYKRRWDEQWKVGNEWRTGAVAYAAEFVTAFEWWLKEKAEWWLENKKDGGPADLSEWTQSLWKDSRIQSSWPVAADQYAFLDHEKAKQKAEKDGDPTPARPKPKSDFTGFSRRFKQLIDEETVPTGFSFGKDYEHLAKSLHKAIPAQLKNVRGKLNVPRERFHSVGPGLYSWAGLQFSK